MDTVLSERDVAFYATMAQVLPVLLLIAVIENRAGHTARRRGRARFYFLGVAVISAEMWVLTVLSFPEGMLRNVEVGIPVLRVGVFLVAYMASMVVGWRLVETFLLRGREFKWRRSRRKPLGRVSLSSGTRAGVKVRFRQVQV